ncbi:MAG TPA: hypothetical protein VK446_07510, partial [Methylocystis sp.]|nr:hypothetical protein [Methylocystis sp.]
IASAARWLSEARWRGQAASPASAPPIAAAGVWIARDAPEWGPWAAYWRATKGSSPPTDKRDGWRFPALAPPAFEIAA